MQAVCRQCAGSGQLTTGTCWPCNLYLWEDFSYRDRTRGMVWLEGGGGGCWWGGGDGMMSSHDTLNAHR